MVKRKICMAHKLLFVMLLVFVCAPLIVHGAASRVFDAADLLTNEEISKLNNEANALSSTYSLDIIIVTTDDADGKSSRAYADDYYDDHGFGVGSNHDGILFLLDMDNQEVYISASGLGSKYLTDGRKEKVLDIVFESGLSDGDYYGAIQGFLSGTKDYLASGIPAEPIDQEKAANTLTSTEVTASLVAGALVSAIFYFSTKASYRMKNPVKPATYKDNSSLALVVEKDILVDTVTTDRVIPKSSKADSTTTTHTSSSGKIHSGGGRKF